MSTLLCVALWHPGSTLREGRGWSTNSSRCAPRLRALRNPVVPIYLLSSAGELSVAIQLGFHSSSFLASVSRFFAFLVILIPGYIDSALNPHPAVNHQLIYQNISLERICAVKLGSCVVLPASLLDWYARRYARSKWSACLLRSTT